MSDAEYELERLTKQVKEDEQYSNFIREAYRLLGPSMVELDKAKAEVERLKAALTEIADRGDGYTTGEGHSRCQWIARTALEDNP